MDGNVGGLPAGAPRRLVDHHLGVGQRAPLPWGTRGQKQAGHARSLAHAQSAHRALDVLHTPQPGAHQEGAPKKWSTRFIFENPFCPLLDPAFNSSQGLTVCPGCSLSALELRFKADGPAPETRQQGATIDTSPCRRCMQLLLCCCWNRSKNLRQSGSSFIIICQKVHLDF
jgi:hypothetical protein